jgi:hypothetical protein
MSISNTILNAIRTAQATRGLLLEIRRGELSTFAVPAVILETVFAEIGPDGTLIRSRTRDFLIAAEDYRFSSTVVKPAEGDLLIETTDKIRTYEALPSAGEGAARHGDPHYQTWRIHGQQTAEADIG